MALGIDISTFQGTPDFNQVKSQKEFVIIRSSYGVGYKDVQFDRNRDELRRLGIARGFYHYAYPQYNTPEAEAQWFLNVVGTPQKDEVLVLDIEENWSTFEDFKNWAAIFLEYIKSRLNGYKPLLYINYSKAQQGSWKRVIDGDFGLWLALWDGNPNTAPQTQWPVIAMKQYSATGRVAGINGDVDLDVFFGDIATFKRYGYQPPAPAPQPDIIRFLVLINGQNEQEFNTELEARNKFNEQKTKIAEGSSVALVKFNKSKNTKEQLDSYTRPITPDVIFYGVDISGNDVIEFEFELESDAVNAFSIQKEQMAEGKTIDLLKINKTKNTIQKLDTYTKPIPEVPEDPEQPEMPVNPVGTFLKGLLEFIRTLLGLKK